MIITITGSSEAILNYLLSFDYVIVIESNRYIKEAPTIKVHIIPPDGMKEKYADSIIEGKLISPPVAIPKPRAIAIEQPVEITNKMKNFSKQGGTIILFELTLDDNAKIDIIE